MYFLYEKWKYYDRSFTIERRLVLRKLGRSYINFKTYIISSVLNSHNLLSVLSSPIDIALCGSYLTLSLSLYYAMRALTGLILIGLFHAIIDCRHAGSLFLITSCKLPFKCIFSRVLRRCCTIVGMLVSIQEKLAWVGLISSIFIASR